MLEILALIFVCRAIGARARAKGRMAIGYQVLSVLLWISFEFIGGVIAMIASMIITNASEPDMVVGYIGAIIGALISLIFSFGIVSLLPPKEPKPLAAAQQPAAPQPAAQQPGNPFGRDDHVPMDQPSRY